MKKERIGKLPIHMRLGKTCKTEDEPLSSRSRHKKSDENDSDDDENDSDDEFSQSCNELKSIIKNKSSTSRLQRAELPYKGRKKRMFGLQVQYFISEFIYILSKIYLFLIFKAFLHFLIASFYFIYFYTIYIIIKKGISLNRLQIQRINKFSFLSLS